MENLKHGSRKPNVKVNGLVNVNGNEVPRYRRWIWCR